MNWACSADKCIQRGPPLAFRLSQGGLPTGDEPHYLIIAESLLDDGDLEVANNYKEAHYLQYYGGFLRPHFSLPGINGQLYSGHAVDLPRAFPSCFRTTIAASGDSAILEELVVPAMIWTVSLLIGWRFFRLLDTRLAARALSWCVRRQKLTSRLIS